MPTSEVLQDKSYLKQYLFVNKQHHLAVTDLLRTHKTKSITYGQPHSLCRRQAFLSDHKNRLRQIRLIEKARQFMFEVKLQCLHKLSFKKQHTQIRHVLHNQVKSSLLQSCVHTLLHNVITFNLVFCMPRAE